MIENLETRRLLAAAVDGATFGVRGSDTDAPDSIFVLVRGTTASVNDNGVESTYDLAGVERLRVFLGAGSDAVEIRFEEDAPTLPVTVYGGAGNDRILAALRGGSLRVYGEEGIDVIDASASLPENINGIKSTLYGGDDNDTIIGTNARDFIDGGPGNDQINGLAGPNNLMGGAGNDNVSGGGGNDVINGDDGDDSLSGGAGNDTLEGGLGDDTLIGGAGDDLLREFEQALSANTIIDQGANVLSGGSGNDTLVADGTGDTLVGGTGDDQLNAAPSFATLPAGLAGNLLIGSADNDVLRGSPYADSIYGSQGNDSISGHGGNDLLDGGLDDDQLSGQEGDDTLIGAGGNDNLSGGDGSDTLDGGTGDDNLNGGDLTDRDGPDSVLGGDGNDTLYGGNGIDTLLGQGGADVFNPSAVDDGDVTDFDANEDAEPFGIFVNGTAVTIMGSSANDAVQIRTRTNALDGVPYLNVLLEVQDTASIREIFTIKTPPTSIRILLGAGDDGVDLFEMPFDVPITVYGGAGDDTFLVDNASTVRIYGEDGNDVFEAYFDEPTDGPRAYYGGAGNDSIRGGGAQDYIVGGPGNDTLTGGGGADVFQADEENEITDFTPDLDELR